MFPSMCNTPGLMPLLYSRHTTPTSLHSQRRFSDLSQASSTFFLGEQAYLWHMNYLLLPFAISPTQVTLNWGGLPSVVLPVSGWVDLPDSGNQLAGPLGFLSRLCSHSVFLYPCRKCYFGLAPFLSLSYFSLECYLFGPLRISVSIRKILARYQF